jgi:hypothetical protein
MYKGQITLEEETKKRQQAKYWADRDFIAFNEYFRTVMKDTKPCNCGQKQKDNGS